LRMYSEPCLNLAADLPIGGLFRLFDGFSLSRL
jgi:hypothetical protein